MGLLTLLAGLTWLLSGRTLTTAGSLWDIPKELGLYEGERDDGGYFIIVDKDGNILDKTTRVVYPDDEFIAENNKRYRVTRVEGDTAYAEFVKDEQVVWLDEWDQVPVMAGEQPVQAWGGGAKNLIAMYSTHSAESYVPTDGTDSIPGRGGIFKVGDTLEYKLKSMGINVIYDKRPHEPRDANAYRRSRRTAAELLAKRPVAIIDIHRDGVPDPDFYRTEVKGINATKIRLVVGRQNQNMGANLEFAKRIKAYNDKVNPGLMRGIFIGRGNYNQDLAPRSILIEVGTHTNSRLQAERGVALFGESLPKVLGIATAPSQAGPGPTGPSPRVPSTGGDWSSLFWVVAILLIGGGAFLLISTGSFKGAVDKLKNFASTEMSGFLGRRRKIPSRKPLGEGDKGENGAEELKDTNEVRKGYQKD